MNVHIDTEQVKNTGSTLLPTVAGTFSSSALIMKMAQDDHGGAGFNGSSFLSEWATYNAQIILFLETSAKHLGACGETLVEVANEHDWVDEDNSHKINEPYSSTFENEVG